MKEVVGLRAKTYSYSKYNNEEDKKTKATRKCVIKEKLKFQDNKNCLEAAQIKNKIINLEKNNIDVDSIKTDKKNSWRMINWYKKYTKDLEVKSIILFLQKLIRLL